MSGFWKEEIKIALKEIFIVSWVIAIAMFIIGIGIVFFIPAGFVLIPLGFYVLYKGLNKIWIDFLSRRKRQDPIIEKFVNNTFGLPPRARD